MYELVAPFLPLNKCQFSSLSNNHPGSEYLIFQSGCRSLLGAISSRLIIIHINQVCWFSNQTPLRYSRAHAEWLDICNKHHIKRLKPTPAALIPTGSHPRWHTPLPTGSPVGGLLEEEVVVAVEREPGKHTICISLALKLIKTVLSHELVEHMLRAGLSHLALSQASPPTLPFTDCSLPLPDRGASAIPQAQGPQMEKYYWNDYLHQDSDLGWHFSSRPG